MTINMKRVAWISFIILASAIIIILLTRDLILKKSIDHFSQKFQDRYGLVVKYRNASINGFDHIHIDSLSVSNPEGMELLSCGKIDVSTRYLALLKGDIRIDMINMENLNVRIIHTKDSSNISFLLQKKDSSDTITTKRSYAELMDRITELFFDVIPHNMDLKSSEVRINTDRIRIGFEIPMMVMQDQKIDAKIIFHEKERKGGWIFNGSINKAARTCNISFKPLNNKTERIPGALHYPGMDLSSGLLSLNISGMELNDHFTIEGSAQATNIIMYHWRISPDQVILPSSSVRFNIRITENEFFLDSTSTVNLYKTEFHPYVRFRPGKNKRISFGLNMPEQDANDFFSSLPEGLFNSLEGINATGELSYKMSFDMETELPDSLKFNSALMGKNFRLKRSGAADLYKMNKEFMYTAYENESAVRTFPVGPSNSNFTPLAEISEYLKHAVLTSEDGSFYYHRGFNEEAFRNSIITNWKEKRFARGGSTISMQLAKNIYLNRSKNVSRKIEEAMIVWLIENNRLVSKERMFEVYLNIIEWGPGVYGIGEASVFYFNKRPAALTVEESIFLAMIVPMPKKFRYYFTPEGHLKDYTGSYFKLIGGHLQRKGIISEEQKNNLVPDVILNGKARDHIRSLAPDTINLPVDSLLPRIFN